MYDATRVILEAFNKLLKKKPDIFRNNFRRGEVYNNGTKGINCSQTPVMPWEHGERINRFMKKVCNHKENIFLLTSVNISIPPHLKVVFLM